MQIIFIGISNFLLEFYYGTVMNAIKSISIYTYYASVGGVPEAYGSPFVSVCVTLQLGFLEARENLSADSKLI